MHFDYFNRQPIFSPDCRSEATINESRETNKNVIEDKRFETTTVLL